MSMKTIYVANDGEQFENEKECLDYEREVEKKYILSNAIILNEKGEVLKTRGKLECYNAVEWARYLLVKSEEDYDKIKAIIKEVGFSDELPDYNKKYEGREAVYAFNYMNDLSQWVLLDDFLLKVEEDIEHIKHLFDKAKKE